VLVDRQDKTASRRLGLQGLVQVRLWSKTEVSELSFLPAAFVAVPLARVLAYAVFDHACQLLRQVRHSLLAAIFAGPDRRVKQHLGVAGVYPNGFDGNNRKVVFLRQSGGQIGEDGGPSQEGDLDASFDTLVNQQPNGAAIFHGFDKGLQGAGLFDKFRARFLAQGQHHVINGGVSDQGIYDQHAGAVREQNRGQFPISRCAVT